MTNDLRILAALIQARARLASATRESWERIHGDTRPNWTGVICPGCGIDYRSVTAVDGGKARFDEMTEEEIFDDIFSVDRKLVIPPERTTKASSAESILSHCLRALHFEKAYRSGALSNEQQLRLLEEVRQYGRAWLRHEAEGLVRSYSDAAFTGGERKSILSNDGNSLGGLVRASQWIEGPGGYLIQQDSGFRHSVDRFFRRAKAFIRELILSATLALIGPSPLTGKELDAVDLEVQRQEQFFDRFHQEMFQPHEKPVITPVDTTSNLITIEPAPMTPAQVVARAEKYADSAWQAAQRINRGQAISQAAFKFERRILGNPKTEHCEDCPPLAALGWQPLGSLPPIGDTECGALCLCHFRYSTGEAEDEFIPKEFVQGKLGPLRAPSEGSIIGQSL